MSDNASVCGKCNTPLVPANQKIKMDGKMKLDGTWNFDNMVCPHCHPDMVKSEN